MRVHHYWMDDAEELRTWHFRTEKHPLQRDGNHWGPFL